MRFANVKRAEDDKLHSPQGHRNDLLRLMKVGEEETAKVEILIYS